MGPERVMLGSDYPYPLGERPSGAVVRGATFLDEHDRDLILGGNAESFLDLTTTTTLREASS
jgi:aminocarboxymuconate-semialdehyde decarboxylase